MSKFTIAILTMLMHLAAMLAVGFCGGRAAVSLLTPEEGRMKSLAPYMLFGAAAQLPSWIGDENTLILFPIFIWVFIACYKGQIISRLVTGTIFFLLLVPFNMMLDTVERFNSWEVGSLGAMLMKTGFSALVYLLVRRLTGQGKTPELSKQLWILCGILALSPLIATLSFAIWNGFAHDVIDRAQLRLAYTILPFAMLSAAALLIAIMILSRHEELERSAQMAELRRIYYEGLQKQELHVRTLRHDLRNHLSALQGLLDSGDTERAKSYLHELNDSPALHGMRRICENEAANAVLSAKLERMESMGVQADMLAALPKSIPVSDADLCALLGNALDNATEAACLAEDKTVTLRMRADRGLLMLRVKNACSKELEISGGWFKTTKKDRNEHGFGLVSMRTIAEQYGGTLDASAKDGCFELVVCLPLSGKADALSNLSTLKTVQ